MCEINVIKKKDEYIKILLKTDQFHDNVFPAPILLRCMFVK